MNSELLSICVRFIQNRDILKKFFSWETDHIHPVCASLFTKKGSVAEKDMLAECYKLLKKRAKVSSSFRGISCPVVVSILATDGEPEKRLDNILLAYKSLRKYFSSSNYLPLAATILSGEAEYGAFDETSERARDIYKLMKKNHPFLTSEEDVVYALLFALSADRNEDMIIETERLYVKLKEKFRSANAVQALSHVLTLCEGEAEEKCERAAALFDKLKENKLKYGTDYELATLGVLAMIPAETDEIIADIKDVNDFLLTQKGYGKFFGFGRNIRLMHAAMIVSAHKLGGTDATPRDATMAVSSQMAAIAQQTAMVAAQNAALCAIIASQTSYHHS